MVYFEFAKCLDGGIAKAAGMVRREPGQQSSLLQAAASETKADTRRYTQRPRGVRGSNSAMYNIHIYRLQLKRGLFSYFSKHFLHVLEIITCV